MSNTTRASLLGLPVELRLAIYGHVVQQRLSTQPNQVLKLKRHYPPTPQGVRESYVKIHEAPHPVSAVQYPWTSLMLTCTTVATEMRAFRRSSAYLNSSENYIYEAEISPTDQTISITWRKLPCWPHQVRKLVLSVTGAARVVVHTLDLFLHCGPSLDRSRPLAQHLVLADLSVNIMAERPLVFPQSSPEIEAAVDEEAHSEPEFRHVYEMLSAYHRNGKLEGYVSHVSVEDHQGHREHFAVEVPFRSGSVNGRSWGI